MNQIAQQGKDMLEIVEKYEVPVEYHNALWAAYERGAHMGFFKALEAGSTSSLPSENSASQQASSTPVLRTELATAGSDVRKEDNLGKGELSA